VSEALRLEAPAKLNLTLTVVGRRDDGFHLLDSEVVLLELADRLLLMPGCSGLRLEGEAVAGLPVGHDNLAWRGLVEGLGGEPDVACLAVEKAITVASGLGGGSSDAAAAWRLGRAWRGVPDNTADQRDLESLAAIGADVPFFAAAVPAARIGGVGERVETIPSPRRDVVLVHPPFGLSTAAVFGELRPAEWGRQSNDLLAPARRLRPELDDLFALVRAVGGEPRLTGSGPTIFAVVEDQERGRDMVARLRSRGARATLTRTRDAAASIERTGQEE
jgi:4-diphosphocytidyl-2-C-methyl-D-erythritol kinase